tara:strand:- start:594 stop:830 length:237 start_codon:yes stop_codon:yes gene_type:complete
MKKSFLIILLTLGVIYYFNGITYIYDADTEPDYNEVKEEVLDTNENFDVDTILDIDMDWGVDEDPKMWIGINGDTIWK